LEEFGIKQGRMEEAFVEGRGSHRAVEPVMMMIPFSFRPDILHWIKTWENNLACG
jgi:hypothetical protein